jgi:hypothetical protein
MTPSGVFASLFPIDPTTSNPHSQSTTSAENRGDAARSVIRRALLRRHVRSSRGDIFHWDCRAETVLRSVRFAFAFCADTPSMGQDAFALHVLDVIGIGAIDISPGSVGIGAGGTRGGGLSGVLKSQILGQASGTSVCSDAVGSVPRGLRRPVWARVRSSVLCHEPAIRVASFVITPAVRYGRRQRARPGSRPVYWDLSGRSRPKPCHRARTEESWPGRCGLPASINPRPLERPRA